MRSKTHLRLSVTDVFFVFPPIIIFFPSLTSRWRDKERSAVEGSCAVSKATLALRTEVQAENQQRD